MMAAAHLRAPNIVAMHYSGCTGKKSYTSQRMAQRAVTAKGYKFPPYQCLNCTLWHITSRGVKPAKS